MYKISHSIEEIEEIFKKSKKIFFIGIGGVSMSSLAHISRNAGFEVSGSDRTHSPVCGALENDGIKIFYSHQADNINGCDAVVYTAAIPESNPEFASAREKGIPLVYRADYLGYIMSKYKNRIGFSGMHGKSTASSMAAHVFLKAQTDPTVVIGANLHELDGGTYRIGSKDNFIMEACEYCDSFLSFTPNIAVVLNIEMDHPDYFKDLDQIKQSFKNYINISPDYAVINADDENVREIAEGYKGKTVTYGIKAEGLDYSAKSIDLSDGYPKFDIYRRGELFVTVKLGVTGEHNIMNALATAAVADICEISPEDISDGLASYTGVARRMEYRGNIAGKNVKLFDDYAHHPTEIRATLKGALAATEGGLYCIYQPHTYSRTYELFDEFASAFDGTNAIFADIYAAREENKWGVSSAQLADRIDGAKYFDSFEKIAEYVKSQVKDGDTVIAMGAGDIIKISEMLLN